MATLKTLGLLILYATVIADSYKQCGDDELCTGLRDKTNVNIYEGDKILIKGNIDITFDFVKGSYYINDLTKITEVVGNIYEGRNK